ncbi:MAG: acido-empty-quinoprotein group A [Acidobacteria bacterium]|nr:acido-empty-quinoprotein group A [Acidobacteriota bacterium]
MISLPIWKRSSKLRFAWIILLTMPASLQAQKEFASGSIAPVREQWTTFHGDSSGKRFSALTQINRDNIKSLTLAWAFQAHSTTIKATPLMVDGVLYFTVPDHTWAVDAKTGTKIWEYVRPSEGNHIGNRGVAYYKERIYIGTPDAHLVCLDAHDGKKLWEVEVADVKFGYYISLAPQIVKDLVLVGTSGDQADVPHAIHAYNWQTGKQVWQTSTTPLKMGDPGSETWPNEKTMLRGGGAAWMSGTYDPDLNLVYWGSANPHPVLAGPVRKGNNLFTNTILAMDADTGKVKWYFQVNPHDTHDWDAVQTPILFDAPYKGRQRKLLAQASGNGYYFLLDRETGEHLVTAPFVTQDWSKGIDEKGAPIPDPDKEPHSDGALTASAGFGGTDWMSSSYDPQTRCIYVTGREGYSFWYLALDENGLAADHQGGGSLALYSKYYTIAIDYETGKVKWRREAGEGYGFPGILTTAGHLLLTGDLDGNVLALDPADGKALWHKRLGGTMNSTPMTYQVDGRQYLITCVDSVVYAWSLPETN